MTVEKEIWGDESPRNGEVGEGEESGGKSCHHPRSGLSGGSLERCASDHEGTARYCPYSGRSSERRDRRTR